MGKWKYIIGLAAFSLYIPYIYGGTGIYSCKIGYHQKAKDIPPQAELLAREHRTTSEIEKELLALEMQMISYTRADQLARRDLETTQYAQRLKIKSYAQSNDVQHLEDLHAEYKHTLSIKRERVASIKDSFIRRNPRDTNNIIRPVNIALDTHVGDYLVEHLGDIFSKVPSN